MKNKNYNRMRKKTKKMTIIKFNKPKYNRRGYIRNQMQIEKEVNSDLEEDEHEEKSLGQMLEEEIKE